MQARKTTSCGDRGQAYIIKRSYLHGPLHQRQQQLHFPAPHGGVRSITGLCSRSLLQHEAGRLPSLIEVVQVRWMGWLTCLDSI